MAVSLCRLWRRCCRAGSRWWLLVTPSQVREDEAGALEIKMVQAPTVATGSSIEDACNEQERGWLEVEVEVEGRPCKACTWNIPYSATEGVLVLSFALAPTTWRTVFESWDNVWLLIRLLGYWELANHCTFPRGRQARTSFDSKSNGITRPA
jgi:hypothetical protein